MKVSPFRHVDFQAGEGKKGTDKAVFVEILTTRNYSQLRATLHTYKNVSIELILKSFFANTEMACLTLLIFFFKNHNHVC